MLKVFAVIGGAIIITVGYLLYSMTAPLKTFRTSSGKAGVFAIGETKEDILSRLPDQVFSPRPKPAECPKNWIEVSKMSSTERNCLVSSDTWFEGIASTRDLCPEKTDVNTILLFKDNKLNEIKTECWRPK